MSDELGQNNDIDGYLRQLLSSDQPVSLREQFDNKLKELDLSFNQVVANLGIEYRTLHGLLDGTLKRIDVQAMMKMAEFLEVPQAQIFDLFMESHKQIYKDEFLNAKKRLFIQNNFDLKNLQKIGFLGNIDDMEQVEERINKYFDFDSIFEYRKHPVSPAFSSMNRKAKTALMREFWVESAYHTFKRINNHYQFDRQGLVDFFPTIRWHSMNVEKGLFQVARALFKLGVTLVYQSYVPTLLARGATFAVNDRPSIVLTDYQARYPTLWFALIHELYHVLFDWEEIKVNTYHISGEPDLFAMKESEANAFAREYLFSAERMEEIRPHIKDQYFIYNYAKQSHVHPSIIYAFYSFDNSVDDKSVWARYKRHMPDIDQTVKSLIDNPWQSARPIRELAHKRNTELYNVV